MTSTMVDPIDVILGLAPQRKGRGPAKTARMPLKGSKDEIKELARLRTEVSTTMLAKRLKEFTPAEYKMFQKEAKISHQHASRLRGTYNIEAYREWTTDTWEEWCTDPSETWYSCRLERLADEFCAVFRFRPHISTLQRWLPRGAKLGKPPGTYIKPSNDPSYHWKMVSSGKRRS